jgi:hypothetical protein
MHPQDVRDLHDLARRGRLQPRDVFRLRRATPNGAAVEAAPRRD